MSGLEIAGVVLGAFPVVITALDKYQDMARMWGFWWEIRSQYQKCSSELKFHKLCFDRNLKQLILPLVADAAHIKQLLADPGGSGWQDVSIASQLEDRLQDSHELYVEIIQQLRHTLEELKEELALDKENFQRKLESAKVPNSKAQGKLPVGGNRRPFSKATREYELYRLKFTVGEPKRKALFQELSDYNERLEKLLTTSDTLAQLESTHGRLSKPSKSAITSTVEKFWCHADRLYKILLQAWQCTCAKQHQANIVLQHRPFQELDFGLVFVSHPSNSITNPNAWHSRGTKIQLVDPPLSDAQYTTITFHTGAKTPSTTPHTVPKPTTSILRTNCSSQMQATPLTPPPSGQPPASSSVTEQIKDLCQTLQKEAPPKSCYGFLEDDHKRYYLYPSSKLPLTMERPVTLDDLLRHRHSPPLSRRQRYTLALTVASSFLQLRDSAWLTSSWTKGDISFLKDPDNSNVLLLDSPFITRDFSSTPRPQPTQTDNISSIPLLGLLLLELCFGSLIEEQPSRQRYPRGDDKSGPMFDLLAAMDWSREVVDEAGPDFAGATQWCLLDSRKLTAGKAWRHLLFENVVQPLERCYVYLNPTKASSAPTID